MEGNRTRGRGGAGVSWRGFNWREAGQGEGGAGVNWKEAGQGGRRGGGAGGRGKLEDKRIHVDPPGTTVRTVAVC